MTSSRRARAEAGAAGATTHARTKTKTVELLTHVNKRTNGLKEIEFPLEGVIEVVLERVCVCVGVRACGCAYVGVGVGEGAGAPGVVRRARVRRACRAAARGASLHVT